MPIPLIVWGGMGLASALGLGVFSIKKDVLANKNTQLNTELEKAKTKTAETYAKLPEESRIALTPSKFDDFLLGAKKIVPVVTIAIGVLTLGFLLFKR